MRTNSTTNVASNQQLEPELLPCPFCGGKAAWGEGEQKTKYGNEQVYCSDCWSITAPEGSKEEAAENWNSRVSVGGVVATDLNQGVWFKAAVSGLWYQNHDSAGGIAAVRVNGVRFNLAPEALCVCGHARKVHESFEDHDECLGCIKERSGLTEDHCSWFTAATASPAAPACPRCHDQDARECGRKMMLGSGVCACICHGAPVAPKEGLFEAKLLGFGEGDRIRLCEPCLRRAVDDHLVSFSCALPAAPAPAENDSCSHWREGDSDNCVWCGVPKEEAKARYETAHEARYQMTHAVHPDIVVLWFLALKSHWFEDPDNLFYGCREKAKAYLYKWVETGELANDNTTLEISTAMKFREWLASSWTTATTPSPDAAREACREYEYGCANYESDMTRWCVPCYARKIATSGEVIARAAAIEISRAIIDGLPPDNKGAIAAIVQRHCFPSDEE